MPGILTFTTPVAVPDIRRAILGRVSVDDEASLMTVPVTLLGAPALGAIPYCEHVLTIGNGTAEGFRVRAGGQGGFVARTETFVVSGGTVATAFTACRSAFSTGGRNGLISALQNLGLLPAGAVS